jgi:hypothetical protein
LNPLTCYNEHENRAEKEENMTHRDEGHYAQKRQARRDLDQAVAGAVGKRSVGRKISCADAFHIAGEMGIEPSEVGRILDLMERKIIKCQLGLFGYEPGRHLVVEPAEAIPPELERALRSGLVNGRLPCATAWKIATQFNVPKVHITAACERLNLRICLCQLGTF